jgi:quercetin dioxygenase-like cupin family protein
VTNPNSAPDVRTNLFGGSGSVRVWNLLGRALPVPPFSAVLACELEPSGSVGAHRQERDSELIVGLDGQGRVSVDGQQRPLLRHDVVALPVGAVLTIQNLSDTEPLRYLIVKALPGSP